MREFVEALAADTRFAAAIPARPGERSSIGGVIGSSALLAAAAARALRGPTALVITADPDEAEHAAADLELFGEPVLLMPPRGSQPEQLRLRLEAAEAARRRGACVVVAPIIALLEPLPSEERVRSSVLSTAVGQPLRLADLMRRLIEGGFERVPMVTKPGELSLRGELFDLWPHASDVPVRIEVFEDRVESIRRFEAGTQRSIEKLDRMAVTLVRDSESGGIDPIDAFAADATVIFVETTRVEERGEGLCLQSDTQSERYRRLQAECARRPRLDLRTLPGGDLDLGARTVREMGIGLKATHDALSSAAREALVRVYCANDAERHRLQQILRDRGVDSALPIDLRIGELGRGFVLPRIKLVALTHAELSGAIAIRRPLRKKKMQAARAIEGIAELKPGDYVVHAVHGVGRFLGTQRMEKGAGEEEYLVIEFAEDTKLFVPASRIDLVGKYVGAGRAAPPLDKIGGLSFARRKAAVKRAVADLAAELLELQAVRQTRTGFACPSDDELQHEFEAAFPYRDTEDQVTVTAELKGDLESTRPMDRLLCGDVGYGKTELSMRAAFKVVRAGRQVAVLVPTTVLAQQHMQSFRERFADFPVIVESISRFRSEKEIREILRRAKEGAVDVLIGTHRILSKDVEFRDLGLVIIDEEQRFGVRAKERLKRLRASVDVLSMTATPIPRTLHQALVGLRDISSLTTPPPGREAVETHVADCEEDELIQRAMRFELNRGGQVYFVHNRIASLEVRARHLATLVPEASYSTAHGQMGDDALEETMGAFVAGDFDVLVTTAIVESGLDIPRANTIFLDHAEWFGLADLHQLRGRVGRGSQKGYCYLLRPRHGALGADAKARLQAIEELQQLGAGFDIAMRDLEIRGAGNLLGAEQSGHIAAVGYDLYCRLLKATVDRMAAERRGRAQREEAVAAKLGIPKPQPVERAPVRALSDEDDRGAELHADAPEVESGFVQPVAPRVAPDDGRGIPLKAVAAAADAADEELAPDLELGVRAFLSERFVPDRKLRLEVYRLLDGIRDRKSYDSASADLKDRFGRIPREAKLLMDLFYVKNRLRASSVKLISYARDRYMVDFTDRKRLERALGPAFRDRRWVEEGRVHLVFPNERQRSPEDALAMLVKALGF